MLDFPVGEPQSIDAGGLFVALDGEVSALVQQGNGIVKDGVNLHKERGINLFVGQTRGIVICLFHDLHQERRGNGFDPVLLEFFRPERFVTPYFRSHFKRMSSNTFNSTSEAS